MSSIIQPMSNFIFTCWYQPLYVFPCFHTFPLQQLNQANTPPVLTHRNPTDFGPMPFTINIEEATKRNQTFRTVLWTGDHLQLTLMSIAPGEDIGLEIHPHVDQFIRLEEGHGIVQMGRRKDQVDLERHVQDSDSIIIPAGTWHNLTNTGTVPIKLYTIYAPPNHPHGTVHETKAIAEEMESTYTTHNTDIN
ncbi:cupin domain-containing protein [Sporosarcina ureae]|uniref:cupin domain-containing protein n=1 Tax=Sporosarcina ureae TaxID=1571 RepID=UPI0026F2AB54|nr:cupin domain-containing protein [Sporosarcina ureae]